MYLKSVFKRTSTCEYYTDFWFQKQISSEDAVVNAFFSLIILSWNGIILVQKGNIIGFSIMKMNCQMWDSSFWTTIWNPIEGWGKIFSSSKTWKWMQLRLHNMLINCSKFKFFCCQFMRSPFLMKSTLLNFSLNYCYKMVQSLRVYWFIR